MIIQKRKFRRIHAQRFYDLLQKQKFYLVDVFLFAHDKNCGLIGVASPVVLRSQTSVRNHQVIIRPNDSFVDRRRFAAVIANHVMPNVMVIVGQLRFRPSANKFFTFPIARLRIWAEFEIFLQKFVEKNTVSYDFLKKNRISGISPSW